MQSTDIEYRQEGAHSWRKHRNCCDVGTTLVLNEQKSALVCAIRHEFRSGYMALIRVPPCQHEARRSQAFVSVATKMVNNAFAVAPGPALQAALRASSDAKALPEELQKVLHAAPSR